MAYERMSQSGETLRGNKYGKFSCPVKKPEICDDILKDNPYYSYVKVSKYLKVRKTSALEFRRKLL